MQDNTVTAVQNLGIAQKTLSTLTNTGIVTTLTRPEKKPKMTTMTLPIRLLNKLNKISDRLAQIYGKKHVAPYQVIETLLAIEPDLSNLTRD